MARTARITVVADTGALYALVDRSDAWHQRVASWWSSSPRRILVPTVVLPELMHLVQHRISVDAEIAVAKSFRDGEFDVVDHELADFARAHELMTTFRDLPLGFVDAIVIATAERMGAGEVLTTDRRHFTIAPAKRTWALVP